MMLIRPIESRDLPALIRFAEESGHGFTSLPKDAGHLQARIESAEAAFASSDTGQHSYLFVMEDSDTGEVVGTSGIESEVGMEDSLYHYHLSKVVHASRELGIHNSVDVLSLCNDYTGVSEICTLFLTPNARQRYNGYLLSRFRFMYMAQHRECFSDTVIAEMRGVSDEMGRSPFWGWLQNHFFSIDLADAVYRVGMGQKSFIAELMPSYPVYTSLLDEPAQAVIGKVHQQTAPALKMLEREGFEWRRYIDPFDAGPTVEAKLEKIKTVANSRVRSVRVVEQASADAVDVLVANGERAGFRATIAAATICSDTGELSISADVADLLNVESGSSVRAITIQE